jgi:hypothetical protein
MTGIIGRLPVTRFTCGHVGRMSVLGKTGNAFIRVAEIRNARVNQGFRECPSCRGRISYQPEVKTT